MHRTLGHILHAVEEAKHFSTPREADTKKWNFVYLMLEIREIINTLHMINIMDSLKMNCSHIHCWYESKVMPWSKAGTWFWGGQRRSNSSWPRNVIWPRGPIDFNLLHYNACGVVARDPPTANTKGLTRQSCHHGRYGQHRCMIENHLILAYSRFRRSIEAVRGRGWLHLITNAI